MINKAKAWGFVCEKKHKDINWVVFAKWMIQEQMRRFQSAEAIEAKKSVNLSNEEFVDLGEAKDKDA
jgi:hypothetical protein